MARSRSTISSCSFPLLLMLLPLLLANTASSQQQEVTGFAQPLGCKTAYRIMEPAGGAAAAVGAVLLLHGQRYTSTTWADLGTLRVLADSGVRAPENEAVHRAAAEGKDIPQPFSWDEHMKNSPYAKVLAKQQKKKKKKKQQEADAAEAADA